MQPTLDDAVLAAWRAGKPAYGIHLRTDGWRLYYEVLVGYTDDAVREGSKRINHKWPAEDILRLGLFLTEE